MGQTRQLGTLMDVLNGPKDVRIACISDTHGHEDEIPGGIPECDILIHAGDLSNDGSYVYLRKLDEWGSHIPLPPERKILIPGNHDLTFQSNPGATTALFYNWTVLNESSVHVMGLHIYGTPWSPSFRDWAFGCTRGEEAAKRWKDIPEDVDVLVVHGPPQYYGDKCRNGNVGCEDLRKRLEVIKPQLTVCGHIHPSYGVYAAPWGTVVNASIADGMNRLGNPAVVVSLPVFT